jgi:translation initiation factor IF-1
MYNKINMDKITGKVIEAFPEIKFDVETGDNIQRCYLAGKLVKCKINIRVGDTVEYELQPGSRYGRILKRL